MEVGRSLCKRLDHLFFPCTDPRRTGLTMASYCFAPHPFVCTMPLSASLLPVSAGKFTLPVTNMLICLLWFWFYISMVIFISASVSLYELQNSAQTPQYQQQCKHVYTRIQYAVNIRFWVGFINLTLASATAELSVNTRFWVRLIVLKLGSASAFFVLHFFDSQLPKDV